MSKTTKKAIEKLTALNGGPLFVLKGKRGRVARIVDEARGVRGSARETTLVDCSGGVTQ
jgi:hypothetical protein